MWKQLAGGTVLLLCTACVVDAEAPGPVDATIPDAGAASMEMRVPSLQVSPASLDFGRDAVRRTLTISNVGAEPIAINQIILDGPAPRVLLGGHDPRRQPEVLVDPDGAGTPGLDPGASFELEVHLAPDTRRPILGELLIASSDTVRPALRVPMLSTIDEPCVAVEPVAVQLPGTQLGRSERLPVTIRSCGEMPLRVASAQLSEDTDPAFVLLGAQVLPAELDGSELRVNLRFKPLEARPHTGTLLIQNDDPTQPTKRIPLLGRGLANSCPQALAARDVHEVSPLDVVVLDGAPSMDSEGDGLTYEWIITSRPSGSVSQPVESFFDATAPANGGPPDDDTTPTALFFVDLAGRYTADLRVVDFEGLSSESCGTSAQVVIDASRAGGGLRVVLTWDNPGDEDPNDEHGADLDLHLLHPNADNWFSAPYDCHYANPLPDWGQLENPDDDPTLSNDVSGGGGPEIIELPLLESTVVLQGPYLVGVHYYSDRHRLEGTRFGPALATLRIWLDEELVWDYSEGDGMVRQRELTAVDHFWDACAIEWPSGRVTTRDRYFEQRP
jgi:hypothetical protein